ASFPCRRIGRHIPRAIAHSWVRCRAYRHPVEESDVAVRPETTAPASGGGPSALIQTTCVAHPVRGRLASSLLAFERGYHALNHRRRRMARLVRQLALVSDTSGVSFSDLTRTSAALQKQVTRDFGPVWGVRATVDAFETLEDIPLGYWPIIVRDD